jgi:hypothetical protein
MNIKLGDAAEWCKTASEAFHIIQASAVVEVGAGGGLERRDRSAHYSIRQQTGDSRQQRAEGSGGVLSRREEARERSPGGREETLLWRAW